MTSRAAYESARAAAATHLALRLAEDALCETAYLADVAGLSYDVRPFTFYYGFEGKWLQDWGCPPLSYPS